MPETAGDSARSRAYFKMTNNYINERIKAPKYLILLNGKEVKKIPFYKQARKYVERRNGQLFGDRLELVDMETGECII